METVGDLLKEIQKNPKRASQLDPKTPTKSKSVKHLRQIKQIPREQENRIRPTVTITIDPELKQKIDLEIQKTRQNTIGMITMSSYYEVLLETGLKKIKEKKTK